MYTVYNGVRSGAISPPAKDEAGDYQWTPADVARLRRYLDALQARREAAAARRTARLQRMSV